MASMNKTIYEEIARKMREIPLDGSISSYEWEELVQKLCASHDPWLHDVGIKELVELGHKHAMNGEK